eukprot:Gb_13651 [translate_table: standard]
MAQKSLEERSRSIVVHKPWSVGRFDNWLDGRAALGAFLEQSCSDGGECSSSWLVSPSSPLPLSPRAFSLFYSGYLCSSRCFSSPSGIPAYFCPFPLAFLPLPTLHGLPQSSTSYRLICPFVWVINDLVDLSVASVWPRQPPYPPALSYRALWSFPCSPSASRGLPAPPASLGSLPWPGVPLHGRHGLSNPPAFVAHLTTASPGSRTLAQACYAPHHVVVEPQSQNQKQTKKNDEALKFNKKNLKIKS